MKKLLTASAWIVIFLATIIGGGIGKLVGKAASTTDSPQQIEAKLIEGFTMAATSVNQKLPMMVDQNTRLDKMTVGPGPRAVYHYTFPTYTSIDIDANLLQTNLKPEVTRKVCASDDMKKSIQYGGIYVFEYSGNDGIQITSFQIDRNDCGYKITSP